MFEPGVKDKKVALAAAAIVVLAIVAVSFVASTSIIATLASHVLDWGNPKANGGNPPPRAPAFGPQPDLGKGHDPAGGSMRIPFA